MDITVREGNADDLGACLEIQRTWLRGFQDRHPEEDCWCPAGLPVPWLETQEQVREHLASAGQKRALLVEKAGSGVVAYLLYRVDEGRRQVLTKGHQPMWRHGEITAVRPAVEGLLERAAGYSVDRVCAAIHGFAWETGMLRMAYGAMGFDGNLRYEMVSRSFDTAGGRSGARIRPAEDVDVMAFYEAEVASGHASDVGGSREDCEFSQKSWNVKPDRDWLIAYLDDRVAGTARVATTKGGIGVLDDISVNEDFRGRGVGRDLLSHAMQALKGRTNVVWLDVDDDNHPAIHLYRSAGFLIQHHHGILQLEIGS